MKLYSILNHYASAVYACQSLTDAQESLHCEIQALRETVNRKTLWPYMAMGGTAIIDESGYVYAEIHTLDVETTEWDIEMWSVLQEANGL